MSTKDNPGPFDGLERAEPVFTLRAHDPLAAPLVHEWVTRRREKLNDLNLAPEKQRLELIQCAEAEEIAWRMEAWRKGNEEVVVITEEKPSGKPTYSGHQSSAEELAAKARFDVVKGSSSSLHNSVAEVTEAAAALEQYGYAEERAVLNEAAGLIKAVAMHVQPKRASYAIGEPDHLPIDAAAFGTMRGFQTGVGIWMLEVFGADIAMDPLERIMRFLEEALELAQAMGMTATEAERVVAYVWSRPVGEPTQEVGGVMVTLAAFCFRTEIDLQLAAITEYERINTPEMRLKIFGKQAEKRLAGLTSDGGFRT